MTEQMPGHPAWEELQAYGQGRLAPEATSALEHHLADCTSCCARLEQAPGDGFLGRLRDAAAHDAPGRRRTLAGGATVGDAPGLPAELAEHPRYRVLGLLGQGGMGAVYRAEDRRMERPVALKVIHPGLKRHAPLVERFHQEVRAAARLHHANIVTAYDADQAGGLHFLVMEYIEGTSLAELLRARGPLPVAQACDYVRQAALGLQHAHEQGMVHRDIKPHNLMVVGDGTAAPQLKILDFGLARLRHAPDGAAAGASATGPLTAAGVLMGTADYIAPEQAADPRAADIRADIYALGCTLFHLLTGRPPFPDGPVPAKLARHADTPLPWLPALRPDVPPGLAAVLARMTAKEPADRPATPAEVAEALAPFCRPVGTRPPRRRRRRLYFAAAVVLAAGLLAAVVTHLGTTPDRPAVPDDGQGLEVPVRHPKALTAQDAEARAIAAVQKLGGRILRSGNPDSGTIDSVRLTGTKATDADLRAVAALPTVRFLDLGGTRVTDAGLKELTGLTRLTDLTLDHTKVTDAGLRYVGGLKQLRVLDLQWTSVGDIGLRHLAALEQPSVLRLGWTRVTDTGMADVGRWPDLTQLNLDGTAVTDLGLARLAGLTRLTALSLYQAQGVSDEGMKVVRQMRQLQSLDLCHTRVTDRGLKELAGLTHLISLRLAGLNVTDPGLEALRPLTELQTLDLSNTQVSDLAMKEVARHRRLTFLLLQSAKRVTDAGLKDLAALQRLQTLVLAGTAVTDAGLGELTRLPQLNFLVLTNTDVTDAGLKELRGCPRLRVLHVMGAGGVTAAGVAELRKERPGLKILHSGQAGGPVLKHRFDVGPVPKQGATMFVKKTVPFMLGLAFLLPTAGCVKIKVEPGPGPGKPRVAGDPPPKGAAFGPAEPGPQDAAAAAEIKKLNGWVEVDKASPDRRVTKVHLSGSKAQDADLAVLKRLPRLRAVHLGGLKITGKGLEQLKGMSELEELDLVNCQLKPDDLAVLETLPRLRVLNLAQTGITDKGLEHLRGLKSLEKLDLLNDPITDAGLEPLAGLTSLKDLVLPAGKHPGVTDAGVARLKNLAELRKLYLAFNCTDKALAELKPFQKLRRLELFGHSYTDKGLEQLQALPELRELRLFSTRVTGEGLSHLKGLRVLELQNCPVSKKGLEALKDLKGLEELELSQVKSFNDADLDILAGLTNLRKVSLYGTDITDAGLEKLKALPNLRDLHLARTRVTRAGIDALIKSKPGLSCSW